MDIEGATKVWLRSVLGLVSKVGKTKFRTVWSSVKYRISGPRDQKTTGPLKNP